MLEEADVDHGPRFLLVEMLDADARRPEIEAVLGGRCEGVEASSPNDGLYRRVPPSSAA